MLRYKLASLVELHPYLWAIAWYAVHRLSFLLPHDRSYLAIRHFKAKEGDLLLDVGANDGISMLSFRKIDKSIRILSLEPNKVHAKALARLKAGDPKFDYKMAGAGEQQGTLTLYSPCYSGISLHTFASSSAEQVREAVAKSFGERVAGAIEIEAIEAPIVTVDSLHVDPCIVKVDVEGFEMQVLDGARATVERSRPFMIVEGCHSEFGPIQTYFDEHNYTLLTYDSKADHFQRLSEHNLSYVSGARNVFAVPAERVAGLPVMPSGAS